MTIGPLVPCIWLDDRAEEAGRFYASTFPSTRVEHITRYPASFDNPSHKARGSVMTVEIGVGAQHFVFLNGGPIFKPNPTLSFFIHAKDAAGIDRLFKALVDGGGRVLMALDKYPFSDRYAFVQDRFGVAWQVMQVDERAMGGGFPVVPCLMFTGKNQGRAETALDLYAGAFPDGSVLRMERYANGEGPEGEIKHGRVHIAGQDVIAMDAHAQSTDAKVAFDEAASLQVMCDSQGDIDKMVAALTADGGTEGPCGWLRDRFGFSWQVVPRQLPEWLRSDDVAARDRVFKAMLDMKRLDIAALSDAYNGAGVIEHAAIA